jgi:hypothetical protein
LFSAPGGAKFPHGFGAHTRGGYRLLHNWPELAPGKLSHNRRERVKFKEMENAN